MVENRVCFASHRIQLACADDMAIVRLEDEPGRGHSNYVPTVVKAMVMKVAQENEVVAVGRTAVGPVLQVMRLRSIGRHTAARKTAEAVSHFESSTQSIRRNSLLAPDIDGQPIALGNDDDL